MATGRESDHSRYRGHVAHMNVSPHLRLVSCQPAVAPEGPVEWADIAETLRALAGDVQPTSPDRPVDLQERMAALRRLILELAEAAAAIDVKSRGLYTLRGILSPEGNAAN